MWLALALGFGFGCKPASGAQGEGAASGPKPAPAAAPSVPKSGDDRSGQPAPSASEAFPAPPDLTAPPADAQKTASGLVTRVLKAGTGDRTPTVHDSVRVHYAGWKQSGKLINSSMQRGGPETFSLQGVIPGWAEGLQLMRVGEKRRLWIPDHLSYVRPGPPRGTVVFDIELLEIIAGETREAPEDVAAPPADAITTKSGLAYKVLEAGSGAVTEVGQHSGQRAAGHADEAGRPRPWDRVTLRYAGWTTSGDMFEASSRSTFDVGKVMPGWREALLRMTVGERMRLWVPAALAYQGRSGLPKGTVVFDLELLSIERRPEPPQAPKDVAAVPKDAIKTASGLAYRILVKGAGQVRPGARSRVQVHYAGWTADGELFDSTVVRGKPRTVPLGSVIPGWREGLQLLAEGDKALFWIPEKLAYGGAPGAPAGMLVYELELLKVMR